ncbi:MULTISPECIES: ketopantoate reductase family protein [Ramlibacter]|uniref:2-dehydropantoate 2-reductase n=1 Tax=Ramlibacter pinisoli TaxID=2682844 RepID=A0A6N8IVS9_9BURK|nr:MULTISPECIES: 2-dehydropantoate 2-reductase [Ramlibacter]MBA2961135.1 2-dehydropantoate 2-reductase [Ramlibacter sp. CGMCC 1.13660]MVQ31079.1 2-dehydropantoate 2-reductase [Ramlibacter pinisoli]
MTRICIVGAGAVGGYVGAHLSAAGIDTTLVDPWPENVQAMRERGLVVSGMAGTVSARVRALHVSDVPQLVRERPFDAAFIAVKAYDTAWATQLVLPYLAPTGCVVSLQNGINEETIAAIAGWSRTLGCSVSALAAELVEPGRIVRNSPLGDDKKAGLRIGELHGQVTPRATMLAGLLSHGDTCKVTTNLWGERWSKLTINAMRNGLCALTGMTGKQRDTHPVSLDLSIRLGSSCIRVGRALGLALEPVGGLDLDLLARADDEPAARDAITRMILEVAQSRTDAQRPSMGQDILKGRRTEIDAINGLVARRGEEVGVDVRFHHRLVDAIRRIERGEATPSPDLLRHVAD